MAIATERADGTGDRAGAGRDRPRRRAPLAILGLAAAAALLLPTLALPAATPKRGELVLAERLQTDLARAKKLANRGVAPPARRLTRGLPAEEKKIGSLREAAGTGQGQIGIALEELRKMGPAANLDPHYMPALVAAGRAYTATTGHDPVTKSTINPEYLGLERELLASGERLARSEGDAKRLADRARRLARLLAATERRAARLQRRLERVQTAEARRRP